MIGFLVRGKARIKIRIRVRVRICTLEAHNLQWRGLLCILGVTFDSKLLWSRHISDISKKAGQRWSTAEDC